MANASILAAFERMWQHITVALGNKSDANHTHSEFYSKEDKVLRYDEQSLTEEQKEQARINIGVSGSTGSSAQPDYNQNDPTAPDYIKNRPFYTGDLVETELVDINAMLVENDDSWSLVDEANNLWAAAAPMSVLTPEVGKQYTVVINGDKHTSVATSENIGMDAIVFGDWDAYVSMTTGEDSSGFTYVVACAPTQNIVSIMYKGAEVPTEFKVYGVDQEIVKIDPKYLPEGGVGYVESSSTSDSATQTFDIIQIANDLGAELQLISGEDAPSGKEACALFSSVADTILPIDFVAGDEYKITVNGVSYAGEAIDVSNTYGAPFPYVAIGDIECTISSDYSNFRYLAAIAQIEEGQCQFSLILDAETFGLTDVPTEVTITANPITETIHKIDPKFLPDHIQSDWNENDPVAEGYIENRPFYEGLVAGEELLAEQTVEITEGHMQISDSLTFVEGETYFVAFSGETYECVAWVGDVDDAICIGNGNIYGGYGLGDDVPFSCDSYSNGECYLNVINNGTHTIKIQAATMAVAKKIDKKFLPDDICCVKSVNNIEPDENGNIEIDTSISWSDLTDKPFDDEGVVSIDMLSFVAENNSEIGINSVPAGALEGMPNGATVFYAEIITTPEKFSLEVGKKYTITFNGHSYTDVATDANETIGQGVVGIGNIEGMNTGDLSDLRFGVVCAYAYTDGEPTGEYKVAFMYFADPEETELTECTLIADGVKCLDEKYIPHTIARMSDIPEIPFENEVVLYECTRKNQSVGPNGGSNEFHKFNNLTSNSDLSPEFFIGKVYAIFHDEVLYSSEIITEDSIEMKADNAYMIQCAGSSTSSAFMVVKDGTYTWRGTTIEKGIWTFVAYGTKVQIIIPAKQIDKKLISVDWNSNSNFNGGYIKNRTHYVKSTKYIPWGVATDNSIPFLDMYYRMYISENELKELTNDTLRAATITVYHNINGEETYTTAAISDLENSLCLFEKDYAIIEGVLVVRKSNVVLDLGEGMQIQLPEAGVYFARQETDEMLMYISELSYPESVKTLNEVYIPNTIARKDDFYHYKKGILIHSAEVTTTKASESATLASRDFNADFMSSLTLGDWYIVEFNGVEYMCRYAVNPYFSATLVSYYLGNMYMQHYYNWTDAGNKTEEEVVALLEALGLKDSGEPFNIDSYNNIYTKVAGTHTVNIYEADITSIDEQYIPNAFIHIDDLYDRGAIHPVTTYYQWDDNVVYDEVVVAPEGQSFTGYAKISNDTPESSFFVGKYVYIIGYERGIAKSDWAQVRSAHITAFDGYYSILNTLFVVTADTVDVNGVTLTKGIWVEDGQDKSQGAYIMKMRFTDSNKIISETVIPDTIARKSDISDSISTPITAQVGQTIVVKAVDENGKPTEWEAVDPWVMTSTTEGSNKKFKLTVDDNGSITIAEITEEVN